MFYFENVIKTTSMTIMYHHCSCAYSWLNECQVQIGWALLTNIALYCSVLWPRCFIQQLNRKCLVLMLESAIWCMLILLNRKNPNGLQNQMKYVMTSRFVQIIISKTDCFLMEFRYFLYLNVNRNRVVQVRVDSSVIYATQLLCNIVENK